MQLKGDIHVSVRRANGRVDNIGIIKGGHWWQRFVARIRLWFANRRARRGGK